MIFFRPLFLLMVFSFIASISGMLLEMTFAYKYGISSLVDSYRVGSIFLIFIMQFSFGFLLPNTIVPIIFKYRKLKLELIGLKLTFKLLIFLSLLSIILIIIAWLYPVYVINLLAPGLSQKAVFDSSLLLKYFSIASFLMIWCGGIGSVLYTFKHYSMTNIVQLVPNILIIFFVLSFNKSYGIEAIAFGTVLGYSISLIILAILLINEWHKKTNLHRLHDFFITTLKKDQLSELVKFICPLSILIIISQLSIVFINNSLSRLDTGSLAAFWYAFKLLGLISIIPASFTIILFPHFSEKFSGKNDQNHSKLLTKIFRLIILTTFPLVCILFIEKSSLINLIYHRGEMELNDTQDIMKIFGFLLLSVPPSSIIAIFTKINFSRHNLISPLISAILPALFLALILLNNNSFFNNTSYLVAIIYTLSCWIGAVSIIFYEISRFKSFKPNEIFRFITYQFIFYALITLIFIFLKFFLFQNNGSDVIPQFFELFFMIFLFVLAITFLGNYLLVDEVLKMKLILKNKLFRFK